MTFLVEFAPFLRDITATIPMAGTLNALGTATAGEPTTVELSGYLEPSANRSATELDVGQSTVIGHYLAIVEPATLTGVASIECDGVTYEVVGPPAPHYHGSGVHHIELSVVAVTG